MMTLVEFNTRFNACQDSILQCFKINYDDNGQKSVQLAIFAKDWQSSQDDWATITLKISDVKAFRFVDDFQQTHHVISHGIHLTEIDNQIVCEFGDLADMPITLDDLQYSNAFVIGKDIQILSSNI